MRSKREFRFSRIGTLPPQHCAWGVRNDQSSSLPSSRLQTAIKSHFFRILQQSTTTITANCGFFTPRSMSPILLTCRPLAKHTVLCTSVFRIFAFSLSPPVGSLVLSSRNGYDQCCSLRMAMNHRVQTLPLGRHTEMKTRNMIR
jgi:hypothetical protein